MDSWIDDIFPDKEEEDEGRQDEERLVKYNPSNPTSDKNVIAIADNVIEAREEATDDVPPAL